MLGFVKVDDLVQHGEGAIHFFKTKIYKVMPWLQTLSIVYPPIAYPPIVLHPSSRAVNCKAVVVCCTAVVVCCTTLVVLSTLASKLTYNSAAFTWAFLYYK